MIKKLLIGASALALTAGAANAQTVTLGALDSSTVNDQVQTVAGGGSTNNSSVAQSNNNNEANVDQTGGKRNSSVVKQSGNISKQGSLADVTQKSSGSQKTGANSSTVVQVGTDSDNSWFLAGDYPLPGNLDGKGQRVVVKQDNTGNSSSTANRNDAVVLQGQVGSGGFANYAEVDQKGTGTDAGIQQGATAFSGEEDGRMKAVITQRGSNNTAETAQGEMDDSSTSQNGNFNQAYVSQTPALRDSGLDAFGRKSGVVQSGNLNGAFVVQSGLEAVSTVGQSGNANIASVNQSGDDFNSADPYTNPAYNADSAVSQTGNGNFAGVVQSAYAKSIVTQKGNLNETDVNQSGKAADSNVKQTGNLNDANVGQSGASAKSTVTQSNDRNDAFVRQSGTGATSTVTQTSTPILGSIFGGNDAVVDQSGASDDSEVKQTGIGNYANVNQSGVGGISFIDQIGTDNEARLTQAGDAANSQIRQG